MSKSGKIIVLLETNIFNRITLKRFSARTTAAYFLSTLFPFKKSCYAYSNGGGAIM